MKAVPQAKVFHHHPSTLLPNDLSMNTREGDPRVHTRHIHLQSSSPGGSFGGPDRRFDVILRGGPRGEFIGGMAEWRKGSPVHPTIVKRNAMGLTISHVQRGV